MMKPTDIKPVDVELYFIPIKARAPLKFGRVVSTHTTCVRVRITVEDRSGKRADGWGETPLGVQWTWPAELPYDEKEKVLLELVCSIAGAWKQSEETGHPLEVGIAFSTKVLPEIWKKANAARAAEEQIPWLSALVCSAAFDMALHDAFGVLLEKPTYETYTAEYLSHDLSHFLTPAENSGVSFVGKYPTDFLVKTPLKAVPAWHLVGGLDPVDESELTGKEPDDGYPVLLRDWIERDGLKCLKIKLRGNDQRWDYDRLVKVGRIAIEEDVPWLTTDFNCTVQHPDYVNEILDRLRDEHPRIYGMVLYVEQPFPYDLEENQIDVHSVAARKPLFMDESAHDWQLVRLGRRLGWNGVALKTCKTQSGALLSLCWAKAHGMGLMVQDLTNPMLAQIPHVLLAAHAGTIMGVESNGMQFYPEASLPEARIHPGLYTRKNGELDWSTLGESGFGYRQSEIHRELPPPEKI